MSSNVRVRGKSWFKKVVLVERKVCLRDVSHQLKVTLTIITAHSCFFTQDEIDSVYAAAVSVVVV